MDFLILSGLGMLVWKLVQTAVLSDDDKKRSFLYAIYPAAKAVAEKVNWPVTAILAAASLESGFALPGRRTTLARKYNNLFGIKATKAWIESGKPSVELATEEHIKDPETGELKIVTIKDRFRVYPSWAASIEDYVNLIRSLPRYSSADQAARGGDIMGFFTALWKGGYSTHSKYPELLAQAHDTVEKLIV